MDDLAARVVDRHTGEGYTFATVSAAFDAASCVLTLAVNEGLRLAGIRRRVDDPREPPARPRLV